MTKIKKIIAETFNIKENEISSDMAMEDFERWDSLTHMELIANLENELSIEFTADEIVQMTSVAKIEQITAEKTHGN